MDFITSLKSCFAKYVSFVGRATRSEYLYFSLFVLLGSIAMEIIDASIKNESLLDTSGYGPAWSVFCLLIFLPSLAVSVRRLHDVNRSGWWILLSFTIVGIVPLLYWSLGGSYKGINEYGDDASKSYGDTIYKPMPRWSSFFALPIFFILIAFSLVFITAEKTGTILPVETFEGSKLSASNKNILIVNDIIKKDDEIIYMYVSGLFDILDYGTFVTDEKVITYYKNDDGSIKKDEILIVNVKEIRRVTDDVNISEFELIGNDNSEYETYGVILGAPSINDEKFISVIEERISVLK